MPCTFELLQRRNVLYVNMHMVSAGVSLELVLNAIESAVDTFGDRITFRWRAILGGLPIMPHNALPKLEEGGNVHGLRLKPLPEMAFLPVTQKPATHLFDDSVSDMAR